MLRLGQYYLLGRRKNIGLELAHVGKQGSFRVEVVEPSRDFPRKFNVNDLILADGNKLRLVKQDIRSL